MCKPIKDNIKKKLATLETNNERIVPCLIRNNEDLRNKMLSTHRRNIITEDTKKDIENKRELDKEQGNAYNIIKKILIGLTITGALIYKYGGNNLLTNGEVISSPLPAPSTPTYNAGFINFTFNKK